MVRGKRQGIIERAWDSKTRNFKPLGKAGRMQGARAYITLHNNRFISKRCNIAIALNKHEFALRCKRTEGIDYQKPFLITLPCDLKFKGNPRLAGDSRNNDGRATRRKC